MSPEDYLKSLGVDLNVDYANFDDEKAKETLKKAAAQFEDRDTAVETLDKIRKLAFFIAKVLLA